MLTRKQTELLLYINARIMEDGVSPSFEEMKEALNLQSKSGIHRLILALEERVRRARLSPAAAAPGTRFGGAPDAGYGRPQAGIPGLPCRAG